MTYDEIEVEFADDIIEGEVIEDVIEVEITGNVVMNLVKHEYVEKPATRDSPGTVGQQSFDDDYLYICVAPNLWGRVAILKGW